MSLSIAANQSEPATSASRSNLDRWRPIALGGILAIVTVAAYWHVLSCGFVWDDLRYIVRNPHMTDPRGPWFFWTNFHFSPQNPDYYPITWSLFWAEASLAGMNPLVFHAVNLFLHVLGALLVWRVLEKLEVPGAWTAALLFSVHPVGVASVAWIIEGKNTLSLCLYAVTVYFYLNATDQATPLLNVPQTTDSDSPRRARYGARWYWLSVTCFLLALLCKTSGILLPFALLAFTWWRQKRVTGADVVRILPFFSIAATLGVLTLLFQAPQSSVEVRLAHSPTGVFAHLLLAGWATCFYLGKGLLPLHLSILYPRWTPDPARPSAWVPLLALAASLATCARFRATWGRPVLLAAGWFGLMILPVLGFFSMSFAQFSQVADHLAYLALIGEVALLAALLERLGRFPSPSGNLLKTVATAAVVVTFCTLTAQQTRAYVNSETFWRTAARMDPQSNVAHNNVGVIAMQQGRLNSAVQQFRAALLTEPDDPLANLNLGLILSATHQDAAAERHFLATLRLLPTDLAAEEQLAHLYLSEHRDHAAEARLRDVIRLAPGDTAARVGLANVLTDEAIELQKKHHIADARNEFDAAVRVDPILPLALNGEAWILATSSDRRLRDGSRAVGLATRACQLTQWRDPWYLDTLAAAYAEVGDFARATRVERQAIGMVRDKDEARVLRARRVLFTHRRPYREISP